VAIGEAVGAAADVLDQAPGLPPPALTTEATARFQPPKPTMSSDDERQLPPSVEAASQMVYRSSGLGVWGAVLRFGGMPLEKIALFSNSSQVSGKGQLGQAVKLTFAEGMLAPFRVVGPASFVAWFLQYSVMGFVFQSCDRTLSKVMGVPNVYYGDELFEPGNRTPRRKRPPGSRPPPPHPRGPACAVEKSETAVPAGDQAKSIAKAVAAPLLAGVVESAVSNRAEVQRYYGIEQFAKIESKLGWCVSPSAALCATGTPVDPCACDPGTSSRATWAQLSSRTRRATLSCRPPRSCSRRPSSSCTTRRSRSRRYSSPPSRESLSLSSCF